MALNMPANNQNVSNLPNQGANQQRGNWQADAYVNIYLPKRGGTRAKLGALKLSMNRRNDAQVIEYLQNAPDLATALETLKDRLEIDFVAVGAEPEEEDMLDLG
jgi:viroplasmin and RNaseH domain-containing protein